MKSKTRKAIEEIRKEFPDTIACVSTGTEVTTSRDAIICVFGDITEC